MLRTIDRCVGLALFGWSSQ